jgi:DNA polymerase III epsilon subunit-like protein
MTQLAIMNVAYDAEADAVVGILEEYFMDAGQTLDETEARGALERADFIVAHNAFSADKPLLARHLTGTEKMKWLCSFRGIEWKQLLGIQSVSLETLMGKAGLRYEQDHNARADARDLKRLLSLKHKGRTYLGRLLDCAEAEA